MANTFELIASTALTSSQANLDFTSIPSTYTDLVIKISARLDNTSTAYSTIQFNGSSASFSSRSFGGGGTGSAYTGTTPSNTAFDSNSTNSTASTFCNAEIYIPNYAGSTYKSFSSDSVTENNGTVAYADLIAGLWSNTAAINRVTLVPPSGNYGIYTSAYLYGVKNA
jgi:hypothetical protein